MIINTNLSVSTIVSSQENVGIPTAIRRTEMEIVAVHIQALLGVENTMMMILNRVQCAVFVEVADMYGMCIKSMNMLNFYY